MNYVMVIRGKLQGNTAEAKAVHNAAIEKLSVTTRTMGNIGHKAVLNPQNPSELLVIDTWNNLDNLQKFMNNPEVGAEFGKLFDGMPDISVWSESDWASF